MRRYLLPPMLKVSSRHHGGEAASLVVVMRFNGSVMLRWISVGVAGLGRSLAPATDNLPQPAESIEFAGVFFSF